MIQRRFRAAPSALLFNADGQLSVVTSIAALPMTGHLSIEFHEG